MNNGRAPSQSSREEAQSADADLADPARREAPARVVFRRPVRWIAGRLLVRNVYWTLKVGWSHIAGFEMPPPYGAVRKTRILICLHDGWVISAKAYARMRIDQFVDVTTRQADARSTSVLPGEIHRAKPRADGHRFQATPSQDRRS